MPPTYGTTPIGDPFDPTLCNNISRGSAAFILVALALGALTQPPGSLLISPSVGHLRIWRLSPFLCGPEGLTILCSLVQAPFAHMSQRKRAFDIMAKRTTTTHGDTRSLVEISQRPKLELILPVMLQIGKVFFLRASRFTTAMAILYWIDGAVVERSVSGQYELKV
jgi:hypothetical protein